MSWSPGDLEGTDASLCRWTVEDKFEIDFGNVANRIYRWIELEKREVNL